MCTFALGMVPSQWLTDRGHKTLPPVLKAPTLVQAVCIPVIPVDWAEVGLYLRLPAWWVSLPVCSLSSSPVESSPPHQ